MANKTPIFKLLPQLMQDAMHTLKELHNTPEEIGLQVVLGVANLAVQGHYNVDSGVYGDRPISLFLVGLAPTGGAKTTNYNELSKGIDKFEAEERTRYAKALDEHKLAMDVFAIKRKKQVKELSSGQSPVTVTPTPTKAKQIVNAMLANKPLTQLNTYSPTEELKEPMSPRGADYRISKGTVNGIIDTLKTQPMCGLFSSEAGEFFNSHAFQGNTGASKANEMCAALTSLWDGNLVDRNTGMDKTKLVNRRFNMMFLLQMAMAQDWLSNSQFADQGFTHRILITHCGEYEKPDMDVSSAGKMRVTNLKASLQPFHDRIYDLLKQPFNYCEDSEFELSPELLRMDEDAEQLLADYYNKNKNRGGKDMSEYAGFAERLHEHAIRLAATLAAFEKETYITVRNAECAVQLVEFYCEQRKTLDIGSQTRFPQRKRVADKVYGILKEKNYVGSTALRDVAPRCYKSLSGPERLEIWDELVLTNRVQIEEAVGANGQKTNKVVVL